MAHELPNLLAVIQGMDPRDVAAIASIYLAPEGGTYHVSFTFVRWIPDTPEQGSSGRNEYEVQHEVALDSRQPIADQVREVQDSGKLGTLSTVRVRTPGTPSHSRDEFIVKTHAGSDSERVAWLRGLRH